MVIAAPMLKLLVVFATFVVSGEVQVSHPRTSRVRVPMCRGCPCRDPCDATSRMV